MRLSIGCEPTEALWSAVEEALEGRPDDLETASQEAEENRKAFPPTP